MGFWVTGVTAVAGVIVMLGLGETSNKFAQQCIKGLSRSDQPGCTIWTGGGNARVDLLRDEQHGKDQFNPGESGMQPVWNVN